MDTNLLTPRGGKISVHFGKQTTTNLWDGQWYIITDATVCLMLEQQRDRVLKNQPADWASIRALYPDVTKIGKPYVRTAPSAPSGQSQQTTQAPPAPGTNTQADDTEAEQEAAAPDAPPEPDYENPDVIRNFRIAAVQRLRDFFSEFKFTPAARFTNNLARLNSISLAQEYISGYMRLINNPDTNDITEKMKSPEFLDLVQDLQKFPPEKAINERLKIYFGDAGTGKTTEATLEYPDAPVIPCNSAMLPDEILRTFDFNDENGNPVFKPSVVRICMEEGKPVIFDEINLLSFDCLRLLQTITDRKDTINFNGDTIQIKPGFKIVGTMNLTVNDQVYSLPEPLVDRAEQIREFKITSEELTDYAFT